MTTATPPFVSHHRSEPPLPERMGAVFAPKLIARYLSARWGVPMPEGPSSSYRKGAAMPKGGIESGGEEASAALRAPSDDFDSLLKKFRSPQNLSQKITAANALAAMTAQFDKRHILWWDIACYCNHKYLSASLLERFKNEAAALHYIYKYADYDPTRTDALEMLGAMVDGLYQSEILGALARYSKSYPVRIKAADKLATMLDEIEDDPQLLKTVYRHSSDQEKRAAALEKLTSVIGRIQDVGILTIVATCSGDKDARAVSVKKLAGLPTALERVATFTNFRDTIKQALNLLKGNGECLVDVARNSANAEARLIAVMLANGDVEALKRISQFSPYRDSAKAAIEELGTMAESLNDISALKSIVLDSDNEEARRAATEKLASMVGRVNDMYALIHIAIGSKSDHARREAVHRLKDNREALESVVKYSQFDETKRLACSFIAEIERRHATRAD